MLRRDSERDMSDRIVETTEITHRAPVTVTTASTQILAAFADRTYGLIVNDGAVDIYIKLGGTAVAHEGILVKADGGSYEWGHDFGNGYQGVVNGITASGSAVVLPTEGTWT